VSANDLAIYFMQQPIDNTTLLHAAVSGDAGAGRQLLPHIYEELRAIAKRRKSRERRDLTLSTEGLIHEAYLKLVDQSQTTWRDRQHFVALASRAIRQVLIDYARHRHRQKRRGHAIHVSTQDVDVANETDPDYIIDLNDALNALAEYDLNLASIVELRWFGSLSVKESAAILDMSVRSAERNWTRAKAFLMAHMTGSVE